MHPGTQAFVTAAVVTSLAAVLVFCRMYSRFVLIKQAGFEDYLIVVAFLLSVGLTTVIGLEAKNGFGEHTADLAPGAFVTIFKLLYISVIFYCVGLIALKTSILFQYLRFFVDKTFRALAWALMAVVVIGGSVLVLTSSLSCLPVAFNWDKTIVGGHCLNQPPLWYFMAGFTIVTDIAVLILPMPVLLGLHLPKRQKYSLMATFGLGTFGCITAILRLRSLHASSVSTDIMYDGPPAHAWSSGELNIGIICACVPSLRPLFSLAFPRFFSTTRPEYLSNPYPRGASYQRNDSTVELSRVVKTRYEVTAVGSQMDNASTEADDDNAIHVKQNWSITEDRITTREEKDE